MLTPEQLTTIAAVLRSASADDQLPAEERLAVGRLATETQRAADGATGYATAATHHAAQHLDGDPLLRTQRREIVRQCRRAAAAAGASELSTCAEVLRSWCGELCGLDGIPCGGQGQLGCGSNGYADEAVDLPPLAHTLLTLTLASVDWYTLAQDYLDGSPR